jgi:hypothetical protein
MAGSARRKGEPMETINLKSPITFRVALSAEQIVAWSTKTFRGKRGGRGTVPEPKEHVLFEVTDIAIEATNPWYTLSEPVRVQILWSNVLSVQYEKIA